MGDFSLSYGANHGGYYCYSLTHILRAVGTVDVNRKLGCSRLVIGY